MNFPSQNFVTRNLPVLPLNHQFQVALHDFQFDVAAVGSIVSITVCRKVLPTFECMALPDAEFELKSKAYPNIG